MSNPWRLATVLLRVFGFWGLCCAAPHAVLAVTFPGVTDGSFENGPPPASAWSETTNTTCGTGIGDWSALFGEPAPDGVSSFWAGGFCPAGSLATNNTVSQTVLVPVD